MTEDFKDLESATLDDIQNKLNELNKQYKKTLSEMQSAKDSYTINIKKEELLVLLHKYTKISDYLKHKID